MKKIKISSTGTGGHDGVGSHLLSRINIILFAHYFGYDYVDIPFDDSCVKGNSGHKFGDFSTALQNLAFVFNGYEKIDPLGIDYKKILRLCHPKCPRDGALYHNQNNTFLPDDGCSIADLRLRINQFIRSHEEDQVYILDGFSNLFADIPHVYNYLSRGRQVVIDQDMLNKNLLSKPTPDSPASDLNIAVHIRRGDITKNTNSYAYLPTEYFNGVVKSLAQILDEHNISYKVAVHCEDLLDDCTFDHEFLREENPIKSFIKLSQADIVVSSYSSHSSVPPPYFRCVMHLPRKYMGC